MQIIYKNKQIEIPNLKKVSEIGKGFGLMFRRRQSCPALLFEFKKPIKFHLTSLFVFFPFLVLWLDDKNKVIDKRICSPFKFHIPSIKPFYKIVEIPLNTKYSMLIKRLSS
jgi:uncharacterized membrane protein (UPF0127 family)